MYAEATIERSAQQGAAVPPDESSEMIIKGIAPYWRLAFQHSWSGQYLEAGTFGLSSKIYPSGISGLTDNFTDLGFDLQYEKAFSAMSLILYSSLIHETSTLNASEEAGIVAEKTKNLNSFKIDGNLHVSKGYGAVLGYLLVNGSTSPGLFPPDAVSGSETGSPNSNGILAQVYYLPWYNTKLSLQYTAYSRFNGGESNYDGAGRNPADNNSLYVMLWFNF